MGKPKEDLTGRKFNEWTVVEWGDDGKWVCRCSCGKIQHITSHRLVANKTLSCGHTSSRRKDMTGQHFGEWEVLKYLGDMMWLCRCSCGVEKPVDGRTLRAGLSRECGHSRKELTYDLTGQRIGYWEVLKYLGNQEYLCRCECGKEQVKNGRELRRGNSRSCGCKQGELCQQTLLDRYGETSSRKIAQSQSIETGDKIKPRGQDFTNKTIGEITVLKYLGDKKWLCKCSCGKELTIRTQKLAAGGNLSCGHEKIEDRIKFDLTGQQFGEWSVLKYAGDQRWLCRCSCGVEKEILSRHLRTGMSKSCGHGYNEFIDLSGQQINQWKVLRYLGNQVWECECSCGSIREIKSYDLRNGRTKSCGHATNSFKDLSGQTFGDWTVGEYAGAGYWNCECKCGTKGLVKGTSLRNGQSKSCGHGNPLDLTGQKFWEWEAIKYMGKHNWLCRCSCGTLRIIPSLRLRNGVTKSCGCKKTENYIQAVKEKYGDDLVNISQRHLTSEQLQMVSTHDSLLEAINNNFDSKPTPTQLSNLIGVTPCQVMRIVRKHSLEDMVDLSKPVSKYEDAIANIFPCTNRSDREILEGQELDLYYPEHGFAIEFNGSYWHSEMFRENTYHQLKSLRAAQAGVQLFHIFEHEWNDASTRGKIINLIRPKLGYGEIKPIQARKCEIVEISEPDAKRFLETYHLQGSSTSSIRIGLIYEGDLLGVMTLGAPRFNLNYEYEIIRVAWKFGIAVTGGLERLFKYFITKYNPNSIISYANFSKFNGESYARIGFECEGLTEPGYVWFNSKSLRVLSRYQTQKQKLIRDGLGTKDMTEADIMQNLGYVRIYDCGNLKFKWEKDGGVVECLYN